MKRVGKLIEHMFYSKKILRQHGNSRPTSSEKASVVKAFEISNNGCSI